MVTQNIVTDILSLKNLVVPNYRSMYLLTSTLSHVFFFFSRDSVESSCSERSSGENDDDDGFFDDDVSDDGSSSIYFEVCLTNVCWFVFLVNVSEEFSSVSMYVIFIVPFSTWCLMKWNLTSMFFVHFPSEFVDKHISPTLSMKTMMVNSTGCQRKERMEDTNIISLENSVIDEY